MSQKQQREQRESECVEFGCPFIFKCVTLLGKSCTRQGGEKIPTQMVVDNRQPSWKRVESRMKSYFVGEGV